MEKRQLSVFNQRSSARGLLEITPWLLSPQVKAAFAEGH